MTNPEYWHEFDAAARPLAGLAAVVAAAIAASFTMTGDARAQPVSLPPVTVTARPILEEVTIDVFGQFRPDHARPVARPERGGPRLGAAPHAGRGCAQEHDLKQSLARAVVTVAAVAVCCFYPGVQAAAAIDQPWENLS